MTEIKQRKHIQFFDKEHQYVNEQTGEVYLSGTSFIGLFHEKFEPEKVALKLITTSPKYIKRFEGYDIIDAIKELCAEWKQSAVIGNHIHGLLERHLLGEDILTPDLSPSYTNRYRQLLDAYQGLALEERYSIKDGWEFNPELIVFSDDHKIAGQSDLILFNHREKRFCVKDYKTNKKGIDTQSYKDKRMFEPVYHLQDCKFVHYALQLSLYAYFLEQETGYDCESLELLWVDTNSPDKIKIEVLPANYLKKDIERMLIHHKRLDNI